NAVCAHAGGPLEAGNFDGFCVTCPWHASVYDVRTGDIVHGPTAFPQPSFEVRVRSGQIEIRAPQAIARMYTG
ncbi:MAG: Rieske (2Fe-2S) protein, partial [Chloroflexi bacterium]